MTRRVIGNDAIYASKSVAIIEIDLFADFFRNRFRCLNDLPVDVGEVEVAIRRISEVAGARPNISRSEELHVIGGAMRTEGGAVRENDVTMYKVPTDIASENISGVFFRPSVTAVNRTARGGREPAA